MSRGGVESGVSGDVESGMSTARTNDATRARRTRGVPAISELFAPREIDRLRRDQERIADDPRFRDLPKVHRL